MSDIWKCHRCGQKNHGKYYRCMQCEAKKYICHNCGKVEYERTEAGDLSFLERLKFLIGVLIAEYRSGSND